MHVKWFTPHEGQPLGFDEVLTTSFMFWLGVTLTGLLVTAIFNEPLQRIPIIKRLHALLDRAKPYLPLILRIGLGISILLQLIESSFIAPELETDRWWIIALQVVVLAGLFFRSTLVWSGAALAILYGTAVLEFGWFHALDYMFYAGIIFYLLVVESRFQDLGTPALYLFTGLSLAWVGLEKMTLPGMAHAIVESHHIPTFGFSVEDFVLISAFIELGLAWTFIVGILNRFVSIVVTLVFITTTTVFGYTEMVGHTIIHTLLIMFLIQGEGTFKTPFQFHHAPLLRYLFVLVNFCVLLFGLMWVYIELG